ncbi:S1 family peptidase [Streptomyces sp. NBC_00197]|uniref:S1 family peptidase n=1 Tax=Streptomyces sp. NBC_00197 TaxID=2975676 RepID=UPI003244A5A9
MKKAAAGVAGLVLAASGLIAQGVTSEAPDASVKDARKVLKHEAAIPGTSWAVDPETDKLVVTADRTVKGDDLDQLKDVVDDLGDNVELEKSKTEIQPYTAGGDAIYSAERCSAGLNVIMAGNPFLLTAGHCGKTGSLWSDKQGLTIGTMVESVFPGDDYALIKYKDEGTYESAVDRYEGTQKLFTVGTPAEGMQVERSGSTTGLQRGRITGLNATVNYGNGASVDGLIQTDVCAEPGDSGGPLFSGGMALGLLSGGSGNCKVGGATYYQPLNEVFTKYNLSLPQ